MWLTIWAKAAYIFTRLFTISVECYLAFAMILISYADVQVGVYVCALVCKILLISPIWHIPLKLQIPTPAEIIILGEIKSKKDQKLKL